MQASVVVWDEAASGQCVGETSAFHQSQAKDTELLNDLYHRALPVPSDTWQFCVAGFDPYRLLALEAVLMLRLLCPSHVGVRTEQSQAESQLGMWPEEPSGLHYGV